MINPFGFDLGIVVGKFAPLTQGHINLINEAAASCKHTLVVMSYDDKWLNEQSTRDQRRLTKLNRLRWLEQTFKDTPHVTICCLDETNIPAYPNGWDEWTELLEHIVLENSPVDIKVPDHDPSETQMFNRIAIFSSENEYDEHYKKYFPNWGHVVVDNDRTQVPISATMIRENIYKYWEYLPSIVRTDYAIKVMVTGMESTGKSSLVKALAKLFNTSWCEEYGRVYCETVLGSELTLRPSDYPIIAFQHKVNQLEDLSRANKVCFFDTGTFSTLFFHEMYSSKDTPEDKVEFDMVADILASIIRNEEWDLVLELSPEVPWIDDGMRTLVDRHKSSAVWDWLKSCFRNQFPEDRTVKITGETYQERLHQAKDAVFKVMDEFVTGESLIDVVAEEPLGNSTMNIIKKFSTDKGNQSY